MKTFPMYQWQAIHEDGSTATQGGIGKLSKEDARVVSWIAGTLEGAALDSTVEVPGGRFEVYKIAGRVLKVACILDDPERYQIVFARRSSLGSGSAASAVYLFGLYERNSDPNNSGQYLYLSPPMKRRMPDGSETLFEGEVEISNSFNHNTALDRFLKVG